MMHLWKLTIVFFGFLASCGNNTNFSAQNRISKVDQSNQFGNPPTSQNNENNDPKFNNIEEVDPNGSNIELPSPDPDPIENFSLRTQSFNVSIEDPIAPEKVVLYLVVDDSFSMNPSIAKLQESLRQLLNADQIKHKDLEINVVNSTVKNTGAYKYFTEVNGKMVEVDGSKVASKGIRKYEYSLEPTKQISVTISPDMTSSQINAVFTKVTNFVQSIKADGNQTERGLCIALNAIQNREAKSQNLGVFVLSNEDENLDGCILSLNNPYETKLSATTDAQSIVKTTCTPTSTEACDSQTTFIRAQNQNFFMTYSLTRRISNDGVFSEVTGDHKAYLNNSCNASNSSPSLCVSTSTCNAAQKAFNAGCKSVSATPGSLSLTAQNNPSSCSAPVQYKNINYSSVNAMLSALYPKTYVPGSCSVTTRHFKHSVKQRLVTSVDNAVGLRTYDRLLDNSSGNTPAEKVEGFLSENTSGSSFFVAAARNDVMDSGLSCSSNVYAEGLLFKSVADVMGDSGTFASICQSDYSPVVNKINQFVNTIAGKLSYKFSEEILKELKLKDALVIDLDGRDLNIKLENLVVEGNSITIPKEVKATLPEGSRIIGEFEYLEKTP